MIRNVTEDLVQIGACVEGDHGHEAVRVYVLLNNGRPILIDCGSHLHRYSLMQELEEVLDGSTPEYVFLTHTELPHSGNLPQIASKWPDIKVMVSHIMTRYIEIAPVLPLDQITTVFPDTTLELAGRKLLFLSALLKDQPSTHWIYDLKTRTLFTGDGFGYYHPAEKCDQFADEIEGGIREEQFRAYHINVFRHMRWVIPEKFNADLDKVFQKLDVSILAPTHGDAIRAEIPEHLARVKQAVTTVSDDFRKGGRLG